jgi:hypothetical protein
MCFRFKSPSAIQPPTRVQPPISAVHCRSFNKLILECHHSVWSLSSQRRSAASPRLASSLRNLCWLWVSALDCSFFYVFPNFQLLTPTPPLSYVLSLSHFREGDRKSFNCNTYGRPRKYCKQKTYSPTKSFRCNTYKKQGGWPTDARMLGISDVATFRRSQSHCSQTPLVQQ